MIRAHPLIFSETRHAQRPAVFLLIEVLPVPPQKNISVSDVDYMRKQQVLFHREPACTMIGSLT